MDPPTSNLHVGTCSNNHLACVSEIAAVLCLRDLWRLRACCLNSAHPICHK